MLWKFLVPQFIIWHTMYWVSVKTRHYCNVSFFFPENDWAQKYTIAEGPRNALVKSCSYKTSHLKTRVPDLSCGIICMILRLSVLIQYRNVTDIHSQTDRHTTTAYTAFSIALRGKNRPYCTDHQLGL